ncbi:hypothetical protein Ocin01_10542 [Orchesella cincta]|uniref:Uncharacterized protein n=1 Tax=Orchesella cincta TaxID=48709 RepID=A0A1D2MSZ7_ORCCI|nr:hypothetical protein Ocin01_10542 [Orchesella cincta]
MRFTLPIIFVLLACATAGLGLKLKEENGIDKAKLKSLSPSQKLVFLAASHFPQFSALKDLTFRDLFSSDDMPWIDYMFVDIRNFFIQSIKVNENQGGLPELDWAYTVFNDYWFVFNITVTYKTRETQMVGQKTTTSVNEITPNSFKNSFYVPSYIWRSPGALFQVYENDEGYSLNAEDWYLGINGLTLNTSFNYEYVPDLGIQISNLTIDFDMNYWRTNCEYIYWMHPNGTREDYESIKWDYEDILLDEWKYSQEDYLDALQFRINCVLSNNLNNPDRCDLGGGYVNREYFRMNVLQLIETIGLASLDRV